MLRFAGETFSYGRTTVLADVDFALEPGERVVLLGRSGAGKSTLLNAAWRRMNEGGTGAGIALVPQEHGLVPQLSVFHNVYMGRLDERGALYNLANLVRPFPSQRRRVGEVLSVVGLEGLERKPVESLSGGQKQRTALARAIHRGGHVLIADEPVSSVDERQAAALVAGIAARFPTLLLALHDVDLARSVATRIVGIKGGGIKGGRIVFDRPADAVTDEELHVLYRH
ncbi:MAG: ATP-binding cassette domain-containing protein [Gemmobacter sp.]